LRGIEIDMNRTPDALPAMAVTATFAEGETRLVNVPQARLKETDRIRCMAEELKKLNVDVEELPDGLIIRGPWHGLPARENTAKMAVPPGMNYLDGRSDHRIVMALSIAGLGLDKPVTIETAEAMAVTFPNYVELMTCLGAKMKVRN
jgi:3-phosphoshikimate 1-carboxyvinyltransferase